MSKGRILLVEDETCIRELLAEALSEADHEVLEASDGEEAMAMLDGPDGFDLLLTDVHFPGRFDGLDVARCARLRKPGIPVVFATGRPDTVAAFGVLGPRELCLAKPFSLREALGAVSHLLEARPA
ncbi:response regulator [Roseomonas sp. BN140053]|uniref:response regulator n=1 Tax=Roseomonas sp. BN140053 TaxID=3391898 RepID=UPI0039E939E4